MESGSIVLFLLSINLLLFVGANSLDKNNLNNSIDNYETRDVRPKSPKTAGSGLGLAGVRPSEKMAEMLSHSETETIGNSDTDPIEEGNRKILKFGKRVIESIRRNGIAGKEARLLKSGKYRIDWWRQDRRLEKIRKRLSEELERKPGLKNRLRSLGWRNASEPIHSRNKLRTDRPVVEKPAHEGDSDFKKTLLYNTLIMSLKHLRKGASNRDKETREPAIFVYMPITVVASTSEIDRIKDATVTEGPEIDSPTKFSLNAFDGPGSTNSVRMTGRSLGVGGDLNEIVSDISVVELAGDDISSSSGEEAMSPSRSSGQVYDSDRLLQLIPLVVEELRSGRVSEDERRTFGWIFGKRLWQLIEREASKLHGETMDRDLAMFLLKGELAERDPDNGRRRRRQRREVSKLRGEPIDRDSAMFLVKGELASKRQRRDVSIVAKDGNARNRNYDYDLEDESAKNRDYDYDPEDENDYERRAESYDRASRNFNDGGRNEPSFVELIELAVKHESRKLAKEMRHRVTNEKPTKNRFMDYEYDDNSDEDENNYY